MCSFITNFTVDQQIQLWNTVGTWLAGLSTFLAVFVSLRLARRSEELSHKPLLQLHLNENTSDPIYKFIGVEIENVGLGNAFLLPAHFLINGTEVGTNTKGNTISLAKILTSTVNFMAVHNIAIVRPGERRRLIWVEPQDYANPNSAPFFRQLKSLDVVVIYAAFNGKTSVANLRGYKDPEKAMSEIKSRFKIPKRIEIVE
jgi:hypothetical protein